MSKREAQIASTVLMIRPVRFASNPLTVTSNSFQREMTATPEEQQAFALQEFEDLVRTLRGASVDVIVVDDTPEPHTPDSIFPNNWVSFHADGRVVLYPKEAENRRHERRPDIIDTLSSEHGFGVTEMIDLSYHEDEGRFLEGTGSMVLDRSNRIAYACLSSRTHLDVLAEFAQRLDYDIVAFEAGDRNGIPVYHTNVLMNVGESLAVVCTDAIIRDDQREAVVQQLRDTGHDVLSIDFDQLEAFAGNMLELRASDGKRVIAMSERARSSLSEEQLERLRSNGRVISSPIDHIEDSSGGSVRCMLAEVHLPRTH